MNKLLQLHDKVKYHRYRGDITANAPHYKRYVSLFYELLNAFQRKIDEAAQTAPEDRDRGQHMLSALQRHGFMDDARRKLALLYELGEEYYRTDSYDAEQGIRLLMAQLESTLSSIHEYIAYGRIGFILRYPADDSMNAVRLAWKGTDYER